MKPYRNDPECAEVRGHLPLFVGGDLEGAGAPETSEGGAGADAGREATPAVGLAVERHLGRCEACRLEFERVREARGVLLGMRAEAQPELDLWPGIRAGLAASGLLGKSRAARPRWLRWIPYAAAAGLLGGLIGLDRWTLPHSAPVAGTGRSTGAVAEAEPAPALPVALGPGSLRLADPGEERLANTARPYYEKLQVPPPGGSGSNVLATDDGLR